MQKFKKLGFNLLGYCNSISVTSMFSSVFLWQFCFCHNLQPRINQLEVDNITDHFEILPAWITNARFIPSSKLLVEIKAPVSMRPLPFKYKKVLQIKRYKIILQIPQFFLWHPTDCAGHKHIDTKQQTNAEEPMCDSLTYLSHENKYEPQHPDSTWEYQHKHNIQYKNHSIIKVCLAKTSRDTGPFEREHREFLKISNTMIK